MNILDRKGLVGARPRRAPTKFLSAGIAALLIGLAAAGIIMVCSPDIEIKGTLKGSILEGSTDRAKAVWAQVAQSDQPLPWPQIAVTEIVWAVNPSKNGDNCSENVLFVHPQEWQLSANSDKSLSRGEIPAVIREVSKSYPEIMDNSGQSGVPNRFAGTQLSRAFTTDEKKPSLTSVWNVPANADLSDVKVGVGIFCSEKLLSFRWLVSGVAT